MPRRRRPRKCGQLVASAFDADQRWIRRHVDFEAARIRELRQRVSEVNSIDLSKIPRDKASYGSTLVLYDAEREEEVTYRLVTPEESDPQGGLISTTAPVGKSLMGKEEGDEVLVRTPAGARNFEIRSLVTIHDQVDGKN